MNRLMCVSYLTQILLFLYIIVKTYSQFISEKECAKRAPGATCLHFNDCRAQNKTFHQLCGFYGDTPYPIVCCEDKPPTFSINYKENTCGRKYINRRINGRISWNKCLEYQEKLVYPCEEARDGWEIANYCYHDRPPLVAGGGGVNAKRYQFRHMALLGYGEDVESVQWLCGGSLISERFILTAGHCIASPIYGNVTYAALGILKRSDPEHYWRKHKIKRIIKYPLYAPPSKYHDIALLETETPVHLNQFVVPACLHSGEEVDDSEVSATGWGALGPTLDNAIVLQNIPLFKNSLENCSEHYPVHRLMRSGYDDRTQLCYGDDGIPRDTCTGDSGGPIQISTKEVHCTYTVVGITSFGRRCLVLGQPGVYTRVSYYVPWIESIVWPE